MTSINKKAFLDYQDCHTKGFRTLHQPPEALTEADEFRIQQGREVEEVAQSLFPGGQRIDAKSFNDGREQTNAILETDLNSTIFEASVEADGFRARADILIRDGAGYHLIEVKSKTNKTKDLEDLHKDAAYTAMVFGFAGINITRIYVFVIDKDFRIGQSAGTLFNQWDVTTEVQRYQADWVARKAEILADFNIEATPTMRESCRKCRFYQNGCIGDGQANHILTVPNLRGKKLQALMSEGIESIPEIPDSADLTEKQKVVIDSVKSGMPSLDPELGTGLQNLRRPLYFLDFETVSTAMPLYPDVAPWEQCVSQYSLHKLNAAGKMTHTEFLAEAQLDCRRAMTVRLLDELGVEGDIIVYSPFEKTVLLALARLYPDLALPLQDCVERLVDLCALIRNHYYSPAFQGSFSIKKVLPAMLPRFDYQHLAIGNGDAAITRFAKMARGEISPDEIEQTRRDLLAYCKQDTWAMVLLTEELCRLCGLDSILGEVAA